MTRDMGFCTGFAAVLDEGVVGMFGGERYLVFVGEVEIIYAEDERLEMVLFS
jgi:hypothetical protein